MINLIKVTGNSLSPIFLPGDYVIILKCGFLMKKFQPGTTIVFNHQEHGLLIKKIRSYNSSTRSYEAGGTNQLSVSSESLGLISHKDVIGKVLFHIKKPRD